MPYAYADENGAFVVRFDKPAGEYAIRCHAPGWIDRGAVRFQSGAAELELTLDRERHLRGRVRLEEGRDATDLRVRAEVEGATREERTYATFMCDVERDGSFWLKELRPANVRLELLRVDSQTPIAVLDDVRPTLDPDDPPASIDPWDCRRNLRRLSFEVRLADDTPAPQALAVYGGRSVPVVRGRIDATVQIAEDDEVFVVAPGHLPTRFVASDAPERVRLERGIPVHVEWTAALPSLPEGASISLALRPEKTSWLPAAADDSESFAYQPGLWMGETRLLPGQTEATVHVSTPGMYRPRWTVTHASKDIVIKGLFTRSFVNESGRYEIEVSERGSGKTRWVVEPALDRAEAAMKAPD